MEKIFETKNEFKKECDEINIEEDLDEEDLKKAEVIISRDNTDPQFVLTYLNLVRKFNNEIFLDELEKYKYFIPKEIINEHFGKFYQKEISASELFKLLYNKIMKFSYSMKSTEKISFYLDISHIETEYDIINGIAADYKNTKELVIYILVHNIQQGIIDRIKQIKDYTVNENDVVIKEFIKKIKEIEKSKNLKDKNGEELITQLKEQIALISRVNTNNFSIYFNHFAKFLSSIQKSFMQRFKDIEKLHELNDKDFDLFMDLCFFMTHYNFSSEYFYVKEWIATLSQSKKVIDDIINNKNKIDPINNYKLENGNLIIQNYDYPRKMINITEIKNIDKYCLKGIIDSLSSSEGDNSFSENELDKINVDEFTTNKTTIDEYHIEKYLKFDSLEETHINKIKKTFEDYLIKIFTSPVIKEAYKHLCDIICPNKTIYQYYDFLNEKDLNELFKRSRIFMFPTDFLGLTEPTFLIDYEYYRGFINQYENNCSKLLNLSCILVTKEHEILAHFNVRIQNYLSEKEIILSPLLGSNESDKERRESGDYFEKLLYGRTLNKLYYNEILYILDLENYNCSLEQFRANFQKCNMESYKNSPSLNNFLNSLQIVLNDEYKELGLLTVNENLINKSAPNDYLLVQHKSHSHLHRPKISQNTKKIIDEIYASCLNYIKPKY